MKLHNMILSVMFICLLILGVTGWLSSLTSNYGSSVNLTGLDNTRNRLELQRNISQDTQNIVMNMTLDEGELGILDVPYKMIKVAWNGLKQLWNSVSTIGAILGDVERMSGDNGLPLPDWLFPTIISIIVLLVIVTIIYGFIKWKFDL